MRTVKSDLVHRDSTSFLLSARSLHLKVGAAATVILLLKFLTDGVTLRYSSGELNTLYKQSRGKIQ